MQLAQLIELAKEVAGSGSALARLLGVSPQRVNDWASGRAACPLDLRAVMANIAGCDPVTAVIDGIAEKLSDGRRTTFYKAMNVRPPR